MNIGELIQRRRSELDITLEEIGNYVGVSKSTVKKWESGYIKNMRRDKIALLAEILKIDPFMLIHDDSADSNLPDIRTDIHTIAAHHNGEDWTQEELDEIEKFKEFVKSKRNNPK